jgi:hypothetical protein
MLLQGVARQAGAGHELNSASMQQLAHDWVLTLMQGMSSQIQRKVELS